MRGKILNSLNALEDKAYSGDIILQSAKKPLSLSAVARGPKLRLLWAAFQQVEEEVGIVFIFFNVVICYIMLFWYNIEFWQIGVTLRSVLINVWNVFSKRVLDTVPFYWARVQMSE